VALLRSFALGTFTRDVYVGAQQILNFNAR